MESLAVKYRPQKFEDLVSQKSIVAILNRQIELKQFKNAYLFAGSSGTGKTTSARIFARMINEGYGEPIELDAASNNGVEQIRNIVAEANTRSFDSEYKIYIIDEAHALTNQSWQAFLKCLEEPPKYTIFIFCTTDPQKIPPTIINRVQRFNFTRIKTPEIKNRLRYICEQERFTNYEESIDFISKLAEGGMRDAIALLEKCSGYSTDLNLDNVLTVLGNYSYELMFDLTRAIILDREDIIIAVVDSLYDDGADLKLFIDTYLQFIFDLKKYHTLNSMAALNIPNSMESEIAVLATELSNKALNINSFYSKLIDKTFDLKNLLRVDSTPKISTEIMLIQAARG